MKYPFPAFLIRSHGAPFHSVTVQPCLVNACFPLMRNAEITFGSHCGAKGGSGYVALHDLASTADKALAEIRRRLALDGPPCPPAIKYPPFPKWPGRRRAKNL